MPWILVPRSWVQIQIDSIRLSATLWGVRFLRGVLKIASIHKQSLMEKPNCSALCQSCEYDKHHKLNRIALWRWARRDKDWPRIWQDCLRAETRHQHQSRLNHQRKFTGSNCYMHVDEGAEISKTLDYGHKLSEKWKYLFRHPCSY